MRFTILAVVLSLAIPSAAEADQKSELKKLKGEYKIVAAKQSGKDGLQRIAKAKLKIEGDVFTITTNPDGAERSNSVNAKLDDSKKPKHLDLAKNGETRYEGIYKLDGKKLTLCYNRAGSGRPKKFESAEDSRTTLLVFQRIE